MKSILKSIFVVAESLNYEKHFLFEYPLTEDFYNYVKKIYYKDPKSNKNFQNNINNTIENTFSYFELYLKSFTLDNHINQDFIFDIIIDKERYVSFPIWFSKNEYNKRKKGEDEILKNKINSNKNTETKTTKKNDDKYYILLNMFNIVFVFYNDQAMNKKQDLFKSVYSNLESLSKLLLFEEYNRHYLGIETCRIIKRIKYFFTNKKTSISFNVFKEKFPVNNNIYKYIQNLYKGIGKNEISHVSIGDIELNYYISKYTNQLNGFQIKPYHSIIIVDRKKIESFLNSVSDLNPIIFKIIDKIYEMKTLQEISLENNIELNFIMFFANQLVSWSLANIIFKFNNYSTFQISDYISDGKLIKKSEVLMGYNLYISILNRFTTSESTTTLNEIYQSYFKSIDNNSFKKKIINLVEKQNLVQTSIIIYSKLKMKVMCNFKEKMLNQFCDLISHEYLFEKINEKENINEDDDEYYYEDFLSDIKKKSKEDFFILSIIKDFIYKKLYINEISYYTGIKIKDILNVVKKYDYIFDLVVVPLYSIKK